MTHQSRFSEATEVTSDVDFYGVEACCLTTE